MARLASLLPRFVALPALVLLGTATITFAADRQLTAPPTPAGPTAAEIPTVLVVPDVTRQAYVFAKGTLEDAGFAWKVVGPVGGYAANLVVTQYPQPGTRVVDTGAPTVQLTLAANKSYRQQGSPENASPFVGSPLRLAGATAPVAAAPAEPESPAAPATPKPKPAATPKPKPKAKPAAKRPPAFTVPGARREPLDEMPLTQRARALATYLERHPKPTDETVGHFLYQHAWIVTGAELGWWRGAEALEILIAVDRRAQRLWGVGAKSEQVARAALGRVRAQSK